MSPSDVADLQQALSRAVSGPVRFDAAARAMWSADASNYRRVPIGVVTPRDTDDVEAAVSVCSAHDVPDLVPGTMKQQRLLSTCPKTPTEDDVAGILSRSVENW